MRGIIPARAGFTLHGGGADGDVGDHPRSRGVYSNLLLQAAVAAGSSPLARGLRWAAGAALRAAGIIPARAGFTVGGRFSLACRGDHPRSRGVYSSSHT